MCHLPSQFQNACNMRMLQRILMFRGETMSLACQEDRTKVKVDLRITVDDVESSITEFVSHHTTTEGKYLKDKLKSTLVTKCHLNQILKSLPYIPESKYQPYKYRSYKSWVSIAQYTLFLLLIKEYIVFKM
ncbi:hypothetical protein BDC45DRAFT_278977 [Circinella umbellata]|nr:hypothetical protein BDC45DRAFT_278977 [Circinella umbellata]